MSDKPIYEKIFSRDFCLPIIELWWRAETINDKKWSDQKQPFKPYIIFEKKGGSMTAYYDQRGTNWIKATIVALAKANHGFIPEIAKNYKSYVDRLGAYFSKDYLAKPDLLNFLKVFEEAWVWFDAAWWFWELNPDECGGLILPGSFIRLREETQEFAHQANSLIKNSLKRIYPELGEESELILIDEIKGEVYLKRETIGERAKGFFYTDGKIFHGLDYKLIEDEYSLSFQKNKPLESLKELTGEPVFNGKVTGTAKIVLGEKDLGKVQEGDILVSPMTLADYVPTIKKASAIITDEGGMLCHAAIISRELEKPCLVGTKVATEVLKDGEMVEVDAANGLVRVLGSL